MKKRGFQNLIFFLVLLGAVLFGRPVLAQTAGALKLSITPPLFKINLDPGEDWSSTIKLVNNNDYPVTIYAEVLDFKSGATGGVEFIKDSAGGVNKGALSGWVEINREPLTIAPQQSVELPFSIKLPLTAGPGGHYAAILAGSKPPAGKSEGSEIKISSMLASLILVRVSGDVVEQGEVRQFSVDKGFSADLSAKLKVVFANTGNTHLQPAGEIKITNMWGETRATFPISQQASFGNVLPESVKQWEFDWRGKSSIFDAGRMRADAVIGFGEEATQTDARTIYFWTFALKPTAMVLGSIILLLLIVVLLIRRYINKSLRQVRAQATRLAQEDQRPSETVSGWNKLPSTPEPVEPVEEQLSWSLFKRVTVFLLIIIIAVLIALAVYNFGGFKQTASEPPTPTTSGREENAVAESPVVENQVATSTASGTVTITETAPAEPAATSSASSSTAVEPAAATTTEQKVVKASILNGGGVRGAAAKAAELIKAGGVEIVSLGNADNFDYLSTEIRFRTASKKQAEATNSLLGGQATLIEDEKIVEDLVVILGKNFK